jgi:phosphoglycolate phosphatase
MQTRFHAIRAVAGVMARSFVIFDFDGTVADSFPEALLAYNRVAPGLRLRPMREEEVPALRRLAPGKLLKTLGIPMWKLPRLMIAIRAALADRFDAVRPIPGLAKAIEELTAAGCHLAIVTSNSEANVQAFLARHAIAGFETIVAGASVFGKGARLRRLIKTAGADRERTVYIGDTVPDIRAARDARIGAIAVGWGFSDPSPLAAESPDALVESAEALAPAIVALVKAKP